MEILDPGELADALWWAAPDPAATAALIVDLNKPLTGSDGLAGRTLQAAATSSRLTIGVCDGAVPEANLALARALTLTLASQASAGAQALVAAANPHAAAKELLVVATTRPLAAASLGMLVRQTAALPAWEGLVAESATYSTLLAGPEFASWLASADLPPPAADDDDPVIIERRDDVLRLILNRPQRRNAYGRRLRDALVAGLEVARADEAVTVVLEGRGPAFCSGGDLAEFGTAPDPATAHLIRLRRSAGVLLHELSRRTTARLHGACIGAGIELPAFAGTVVAAEDTSIGLPEVGMGLVPGAGGTVSLVRRIGRWRTAWLALTGARIDVEQARQWGLVDQIES